MSTATKRRKLREKGREIGHLKRENRILIERNRDLDESNRTLSQMNGAVVMHDRHNGQTIYFPYQLITDLERREPSEAVPWAVTEFVLTPTNLYMGNNPHGKRGRPMSLLVGKSAYEVTFKIQDGVRPEPLEIRVS